MAQRYHRNPAPHRRLRSGMRGADVKRAQKATNTRLQRKGAITRIAVDGEWGPQSQIAWTRAATLIGLPHNKPTVRCQTLMRNPALRTRAMRERSRRAVADWKKQREGSLGVKAVRAAGRLVGKTETGRNDAPWLRQMERDLPRGKLSWMIPGQPYCGFGCVWAWWVGARVELPDGAVYTPNICPWGGQTMTIGGRRIRFKRVSVASAKIGALIVMNFGSGGAKHVALKRAQIRNGILPTREFNTSAGSGGSQANGDGCWDRGRSLGMILCAIDIEVLS